MPATFETLTKDNKPVNTNPVLLLVEYTKHEGRNSIKELLPLMGEPVFTQTLEGSVLTGFRMMNSDIISVSDYRIKGWCPIDISLPTEEK